MVLNPGKVPLPNVQVTDDRCAPVRYAFGDDGDGVLEPGELWTCECTSVLRKTTSNTATVRADYHGAPIMDDDSVTVWVADPPAPTPTPTQATVAQTPHPTARPTPRPSATIRPTPGPTGGAEATAAPHVTLPPTDRPLPGGRDEPGGMPTLPILVGLGALVVLLLPRWRRVPLDD